MSELDLGLKVASRRLLWRMGFTTRVDVPLRAFVPPSASRRGARHETFTDLDVLGIAVAPGFALRSIISDCKTTQRGSTERMFWVRGVSDFFAADDAWMVRTGGVTAASRQLAARLGISVLEPTDLARLEEFHPVDLSLDDGPLALLFDETRVAAVLKALTTVDRKLERLVEYRQFDYWVYDEHRNLLQVVAHLAEVAKHLDPSHPTHRALFIDCAWLYILSLAHAANNVRAVHVSDVDTALQQYLFGGQMALQEKRKLAAALAHYAPAGAAADDDGVLPSWYGQLLELLARHLRRPTLIGDELRYAEWITEAQLAKESSTVADAFGSSFNPIAAKLLADVCGFLVTVSSLDPDFRTFARQICAQGASATASRVVAISPEADGSQA
ncbi:hypothetical protein [Mycolicibacterium goodii]|uniref:hypothetical protein n=1 Tax=Mycolicibacterium goodii TaxID=134601 RepID=UPI000C263A55|nr:hypothetical protein [Mycolicibacterium goodii]PJK21231.1 hypothetical protein CSX11_16920 [Mycolicibacterium goodii]